MEYFPNLQGGLLEAGELWHLHDRLRDELGARFFQLVIGETVSKNVRVAISTV